MRNQGGVGVATDRQTLLYLYRAFIILMRRKLAIIPTSHEVGSFFKWKAFSGKDSVAKLVLTR